MSDRRGRDDDDDIDAFPSDEEATQELASAEGLLAEMRPGPNPSVNPKPKQEMSVSAPKLPKISLGPCLYFSDPNSGPSAAIVTRAGSVIDLVVFVPESGVGLPRNTVRHISDPDAKKFSSLNLGVWDYTNEQKEFMAIKAYAAEQALSRSLEIVK